MTTYDAAELVVEVKFDFQAIIGSQPITSTSRRAIWVSVTFMYTWITLARFVYMVLDLSRARREPTLLRPERPRRECVACRNQDRDIVEPRHQELARRRIQEKPSVDGFVSSR